MGVRLQIEGTDSLEESDKGGIFLLSLSNIGDGQKKGKLRALYCEEPFYFSDLTEAVLKMEEILDDHMTPRFPSPLRSFEKTEKRRQSSVPVYTGTDGKNRESSRTLFYIQVHYRQNSSWQGEVRWQDGRQKMYFRSVLELLKLLNSVSCQ